VSPRKAVCVEEWAGPCFGRNPTGPGFGIEGAACAKELWLKNRCWSACSRNENEVARSSEVSGERLGRCCSKPRACYSQPSPPPAPRQQALAFT
jgi:hypothetical protein